MIRKAAIAAAGNSAAESTSPWTSPAELADTAQALRQAAQPVLEWFNEVRSSQLAALDSCSQAMQAALEAAAVAGRPTGLLQAQGELLGTALAQASRFQQEMLGSWLSAIRLQPRRDESTVPGLSTSLDQARISFEDALRPWMALWNSAANGSGQAAA